MMTSEPEEVEIKLELSAGVADTVALAALFTAEPRVLVQHAIYFDTPDHALFKAGLSLRIRRSGDRRIQTIKVDGGTAAGLFVRPEWEQDVDDDLPVLKDTTPIRALLGKRVAEIAPLFTIENERRIWNQDGIEIALDRGRIIAEERETQVCEIELEQKGGDLAVLFGLARGIDAVTPVKLGVLSKAQRGYRLLGPATKAVKAEPIALNKAMTAADAFQAIARACIRQFRLNEPLIELQEDPGAIHQARVALRRLRSALTIYKAMLANGRAKRLNAELRWLAGELSRARDLDVLIARIGDTQLSECLGPAREDAYANAVAATRSDRARALMIDLAEWITIGEWLSSPAGQKIRDLPARKFAGAALDRFRRKVKKGGRNLEELDDRSRHELRKTAKKLRYSAEFFAVLYERKRERRRHKRFISALATLQDKLGDLNDLATAREVLLQLGIAHDPQAAVLFEADGKAELLVSSAEAHDALVDTKRFWR